MTGLPEKQKEKEVCEAKWLSNFFFPYGVPQRSLFLPHMSLQRQSS